MTELPAVGVRDHPVTDWYCGHIGRGRDPSRCLVCLMRAVADFDEKWYPQLAGTALGEKQLGHEQSAERWGALCREWRALADGVAPLVAELRAQPESR